MSAFLANQTKIAGSMMTMAGQTVTFRGEQVPAWVNNFPSMNWANGMDEKQPQLLPPEFTTVSILTASVSPMPKKGEAFITGDGKTHRIQEIKPAASRFVCLCCTGKGSAA